MKYLLDTCIVSEMAKKAPDSKVAKWLGSQRIENLYLSWLTIGELQKGISKQGEGKKTYKRWVGGEYKVTLEEGDYLISRVSTFQPSSIYLPEFIWTARQDAPAEKPAPAVLDWTDTTLTLAVSNGCDYALVTSGSAETNWVSMVKTDNTYAFARPAGGDYLCLRRYSITPSNIVSAATAYSVRIPAGTKDGSWYGATGVELAKWPLTVRNVTSQQRYPWNGLVDVSCDLSGTGTVTLSATVLTNGVTFIEAQTLIGETTVDLDDGKEMKGLKFIWNAAKDLPAGFKAQNVKVKVTVEK